MSDIINQINAIGIVPVIAISDVEKAIPLARALAAGGVPCAEITFRTAEGEEAIRRIAEEVPEVLVGAGTVTTTEQVDRAIAAGARFLVSPGLNLSIVSYSKSKNIPIVPGCATPSEMEAAMSQGVHTIKFFPAEQAGGLPYIKAVSAPYSSLRFLPTGGINAENLSKYIAFDKVIACGGSWMVAKELINSGSFSEITKLCLEATAIVRDTREKHK